MASLKKWTIHRVNINKREKTKKKKYTKYNK